MKEFKIYLKDLQPDVRERFLKFLGSDKKEIDQTYPITVFEKED
jgi:hypothetical protein